MDVLEDKKIVYDHWQKWWQLLKSNHMHFIANSKQTNQSEPKLLPDPRKPLLRGFEAQTSK